MATSPTLEPREDARRRVEQRLLMRFREDARVQALARTGSTARGTADAWSDVDLFLGVDPAHTVATVLEDTSRWLSEELAAVHSFDLHGSGPDGEVTYRAVLLAGGVEVDLGVARSRAFAPLGGAAFEVLFDERQDDDPPRPGEAADEHPAPASQEQHLIGLGWHHALHARSATERGRYLSAEHWISALRTHAIALASARCGLATEHAKDADDLPPDVRQELAESLVRSLDREELLRARAAATQVFLAEVSHVDPSTGAALSPLLLPEE